MVKMQIYQHDQPSVFRFVIHGPLLDAAVRELELQWLSACSILGTRELMVDLSGVTAIGQTGIELLSRMRETGARLTTAEPPELLILADLLGVPAAKPTLNPCPRCPDSPLWWRQLVHRLRLLASGAGIT